ncbi:hypothetical protein [Robertkochia marina]|nr:hypothetical protein [Robertkochia marina]
MAQEKIITGTITDQEGLPLTEANVLVKGSCTVSQIDLKVFLST